MSKKALVLLAPGFEEVEAVSPIDYLRRAGVLVTAAAPGGGIVVEGAHGIGINADTTLELLAREKKLDASLWDALVLPGGMPGASNLAASKETSAFIRAMLEKNKWVCAICASPAVVLAPLGVLSGRSFTCFPGMEENVSGAKWSSSRVVVDKSKGGGGIITSRGAGTAGEFAAAIIGELISEAEGKKLAASVLMNFGE